ncbi:MAG: ABC transporter permease [Patescibacteria group bacterium]
MLRLFIADLKMLVRNRQALFWSLMFPLMFTIIFGFFFGGSTIAGTIGLINNSNTQIAQGLVSALKGTDLLKVQDESDLNTAKDLIKKNTISAVVVIPQGFGDITPDSPRQVDVIYDPGSQQLVAIINSFLNTYLTNVNYSVQNAKPIFSVNAQAINSERKLNYFDFVLAGILGMAIMQSSIIGVSIAISTYRQEKILKRITTTPIKTWQFIIAEVLSRLVVNLIQVALVLALGVYAFHGHIYGNIFEIFGIALLGALLFQMIGFVVASFAKTADAAQGMATAIGIPMMFLAGVFFPIDSLPKWLYSVVQYLPLAPLLRILRTVALEAGSAFQNPVNMAIVGAWIVVCLALSLWRFRLSEE